MAWLPLMITTSKKGPLPRVKGYPGGRRNWEKILSKEVRNVFVLKNGAGVLPLPRGCWCVGVEATSH